MISETSGANISNTNCRAAALIVPAYNEARTVAAVLSAAKDADVFREIICVDDGSTDGTGEEASSVSGVKVIRQKNSGKSVALETGFKAASAEIIAFLDADLTGITAEHIRKLVRPVTDGAAAATIGIFKGGRAATDFAQKFAPMISGQRCLKKELLEGFDLWHTAGFGIEHAINDHLRRIGVAMVEIELFGASHRMKEEKRGIIRGSYQRLKMYAEIVKYNITKRFKK